MLRNFSISPNPVGASARFSFEHNQPNTPLKLQLEIFDINGSRVFSKQLEETYTSNLVIINWDASGANGARLLPGFYYCRILATVNKSTISLPSKFVKY
jgi:flagellar hook assembly protein FlgD